MAGITNLYGIKGDWWIELQEGCGGIVTTLSVEEVKEWVVDEEAWEKWLGLSFPEDSMFAWEVFERNLSKLILDKLTNGKITDDQIHEIWLQFYRKNPFKDQPSPPEDELDVTEEFKEGEMDITEEFKDFQKSLAERTLIKPDGGRNG